MSCEKNSLRQFADNQHLYTEWLEPNEGSEIKNKPCIALCVDACGNLTWHRFCGHYSGYKGENLDNDTDRRESTERIITRLRRRSLEIVEFIHREKGNQVISHTLSSNAI